MTESSSVRLHSLLVAVCCVAVLMLFPPTGIGADRPASKFDPAAFRGFLKTFCFDCHDDATATAKLSLESLSIDARDFERWVPIYDKLRLSAMPPQGETQPSPQQRAAVVDWLNERLHKASLARQQSEGRVVLRRLNVTEFETSLRDLLGKQVAVRSLLPEDTVAAGFDNVSAVLDVSSVHLLRYQDAAEKALASVIPRHPPERILVRVTGREVATKSRHAKLGTTLRVHGDTLFIHAIPYGHISLGTATVPQPGRYVVRASLYAVGTNGQPLPVRFSAGKDWGRDGESVLAVRDAPAGKAAVFELTCELGRHDLVDVLGWSLPTERQFSDRKLSAGKPLEQYSGPGLAVEWLEIEGPLDEYPPAGYKRLFGDLPLKGRYKGDSQRVASADPRADAERLMRSFLPQAFRRPVSRSLQDYYVQIVLDALDNKLPFEDVMLLGYRAALCSPHFLFLTEPPGSGQFGAATLDDFAVASRLSYFLWSTLPDKELLQLAAANELTKPPVLRAQVERLLSDPRSDAFTQNFAGQWLDLRKINDTTPDPQAYGEFDDFLFWSMPNETLRFFEEVLRKDRSLIDFTHSDWTFLNERLAQHYGIPGVAGGELRLTHLPVDSHRGGVITHASVMKVTADGTKTSPVLRGKWVLDRILGRPPAPPPANVPAIDPDIRGATTVRQQLDKHRSIEACATCHRHIDPPGFALESFDVIGGWREFYRSTVYKREAVVKLANYPGREVVRGPDVEQGGVTPEGRKFQNIDDYKLILLADKDQLARNLAEKLIVYATGAELQFADREVVEQLVARSRDKNYGFRSLIHEVVQSRVFLQK